MKTSRHNVFAQRFSYICLFDSAVLPCDMEAIKIWKQLQLTECQCDLFFAPYRQKVERNALMLTSKEQTKTTMTGTNHYLN